MMVDTMGGFFYYNQFNPGYTQPFFFYQPGKKNCRFFFKPSLMHVSQISNRSKTVERLVWSGGPPSEGFTIKTSVNLTLKLLQD